MKKRTVILLAVTLLVTGFAAALHFDGRSAKKARDDAEVRARELQALLKAAEIRASGATPSSVSADEVPPSVLKDRIAALEKTLEKKDSEIERLRASARATETGAQPEETAQARPQRGTGDWRQQQRERMEELSREDPDEYARIKQERIEFQQRIVNNVGGQVEFLAGLSTDGLPQEQIDNHAMLLERLSVFREKVSQFNADPAAEDGDISRRELFGEFREIAPLLETERQVVLGNLATELGYAGEEAQSFIEYVEYVNNMTSPRAIMQGVGWGGGRR